MVIAVVDDTQGRGIGKRLLDHLTRAARAAGVRRFLRAVLADNLAMRGLAERRGAKAHWLGDGQDAGVVDADDEGAFIAAAKTRQWDREKSVRTLA